MIREAREADIPELIEMIRELADSGGVLHEVTVTPDDLRRDWFGDSPVMRIFVAEVDDRLAGYLLWNLSYSARIGRHGVYMADLMVRDDARRQGIGRALMAEVAKLCIANDWGRMEWKMLNRNQAGLAFYQAIGTQPRTDISVLDLRGESLRNLAGE